MPDHTRHAIPDQTRRTYTLHISISLLTEYPLYGFSPRYSSRWGGWHCIGPDLWRRICGRLGQPIDQATTGGGLVEPRWPNGEGYIYRYGYIFDVNPSLQRFVCSVHREGCQCTKYGIWFTDVLFTASRLFTDMQGYSGHRTANGKVLDDGM